MTLRKWRKLGRDIRRPHTSKDRKKGWWKIHGYDVNLGLRPKYGETSSTDGDFDRYMQRHPELRRCAGCQNPLDVYRDRVTLIPGQDGNARDISLICADPSCIYKFDDRKSPFPPGSERFVGNTVEVIKRYWEKQREKIKPIGRSNYVRVEKHSDSGIRSDSPGLPSSSSADLLCDP